MLAFLGRSVLSTLSYYGQVALLARDTVGSLGTSGVRWRLMLRQVVEMGFRSQLVVTVTGAFTGAVFAAQTYFQFHRLGMESAVGPVVSISMFRELGPVLTGLMVAGRVGAAIAAEIGTMKATEQLDALRALGVQPVDYLVVPRVVALMISMPLLVAECVGLSLVAGWFVATKVLGVSEAYFLSNMAHYTTAHDIDWALSKGFVFSLVIAFLSCFEGLNAREGAEGVGRAPTEAVVRCSLTILITNFFLSFGLNIIFPTGSS
jgi:phospholipid/cholesterol/gamma-HCH transport system permease protein